MDENICFWGTYSYVKSPCKSVIDLNLKNNGNIDNVNLFIFSLFNFWIKKRDFKKILKKLTFQFVFYMTLFGISELLCTVPTVFKPQFCMIKLGIPQTPNEVPSYVIKRQIQCPKFRKCFENVNCKFSSIIYVWFLIKTMFFHLFDASFPIHNHLIPSANYFVMALIECTHVFYVFDVTFCDYNLHLTCVMFFPCPVLWLFCCSRLVMCTLPCLCSPFCYDVFYESPNDFY